ncbi:alpha-1,2-fucosyltransferase [Chitiniphilus purpureus]|uniref:Alpha-1,2-fucosyltransferase n=1 Tax=Chitiniphilus purpureus TaxID=2981137 RepID=A0ABY6DML2_9NEIS|nr:alpha-1,2-fucosyltransferase [Chitiniphilus sp. CD1]UXY15610.1 alpha-1,2-fucosyltransferase [Chitiniphilus sp. CD1]
MIYYWLNQGRLGNLLFQISAIDQLCNQQDLIITQNNPSFKVFIPACRYLRLPSQGNFSKKIIKMLDALLLRLARWNVIGTVQPQVFSVLDNFQDEAPQLIKKTGYLRHIYLVHGYFQFANSATPLPIDGKLQATATARLNSLTHKRETVAVHVRLGDYKNWSVLGHQGASLEPEWYQQAIAFVRSKLVDPIFILFSDQPEAVKEWRLVEPLLTYPTGSAEEELIAISLCRHAIISPSTFSWWGARLGEHPDQLVIAPQYWAGFKAKIWFPLHIAPVHWVYLNAEANQLSIDHAALPSTPETTP